MKITCPECGYYHDDSIATIKNSPIEKVLGTIFLHKAEFILMDKIDDRLFFKCPRMECNFIFEFDTNFS